MKRVHIADGPLAALPEGERNLDRARASHLLRRAGFGQPAREVERAEAEGLDAALERLFGPPGPEVAELDAVAEVAAAGDLEGLQGWFAARMLRSTTPLREKVALFWHGHFATSDAKVQDAVLMLGQLRCFLERGLGSFRTLLGAVARDPAMLIWLDGERNQKGRPNENLARELFELFTLGIGHYGERDVQEAARALTGFRRAGGRFEFLRERHDAGPKEVLGVRGELDLDGVLDACAGHPATRARLARRLLAFFAAPEPAEEVVAAAADILAAADIEIGALLFALFESRWFYSGDVVARRIASPVEFTVGTLRTLGVRGNGSAAAAAAARMGQDLFRPPSVKGWDGEVAWLGAGAVLARVNCGARIAAGRAGGIALDLDPVAALGAPRDEPRALADRACERLLAAAPPEQVRADVAEYVAAAADPGERAGAALRAALALPEALIV